MDRFVKIGADQQQLPRDAHEWVAVLDTRSNLMWTRDDVGKNAVSQPKAVELASKAKVASFDDWRLPSVEELFLLADRSRQLPAIDVEFFGSCRSDWYWTASPAAWAPSRDAWYVHFDGGSAYTSDHGYGGFVRAVRSVASPGQ